METDIPIFNKITVELLAIISGGIFQILSVNINFVIKF